MDRSIERPSFCPSFDRPTDRPTDDDRPLSSWKKLFEGREDRGKSERTNEVRPSFSAPYLAFRLSLLWPGRAQGATTAFCPETELIMRRENKSNAVGPSRRGTAAPTTPLSVIPTRFSGRLKGERRAGGFYGTPPNRSLSWSLARDLDVVVETPPGRVAVSAAVVAADRSRHFARRSLMRKFPGNGMLWFISVFERTGNTGTVLVLYFRFCTL